MVIALLVGLVLVGGLLLLTDVLPLEALGGFMLWLVGRSRSSPSRPSSPSASAPPASAARAATAAAAAAA